VTLVQIIEEKELKRASTPSPDAPSQIHPQNEHEVESALDDAPIDILGTLMDSLRDDLGSGEQGEEIPQQEIDISTTNYQLSTKPSPNSSIFSSALPPDEK
jgi:hypothetical protein